MKINLKLLLNSFKSINIVIVMAVVFVVPTLCAGFVSYKNYSKQLEVKVETDSGVKGETIGSDGTDVDNQLETTTPATTTKPNNNQLTTPSGASKQSAQTKTQVPSTAVTEIPTIPPENSWTNSHGTFKYSDLGKTAPMYLGKDVSFQVGWTTNGVCSGKTITIPKNTKIYTIYTQVPNYMSVPGDEPTSYPNPRRQGDYIFDLREYYPSLCQLYYYEEHLSDDPNSPYYPGNLGVWW